MSLELSAAYLERSTGRGIKWLINTAKALSGRDDIKNKDEAVVVIDSLEKPVSKFPARSEETVTVDVYVKTLPALEVGYTPQLFTSV